MIGHCIAQLWEAGALDVYTTAIQMKKNRPGVKLSVLLPRGEDRRGLEQILFRETGTLGIRRWPGQPAQAAPPAAQVETPWGPVEGKLGLDFRDGRPASRPNTKSCRRVAATHDVPLRDVYEAAHKAFAGTGRNRAADRPMVRGLEQSRVLSREGLLAWHCSRNSPAAACFW